MTDVTDSPMPPIATSREKAFARLPSENAKTSFFEGREFRFIRKITAPIVFRFVAPVEFILSFQGFGIVDGEYEFYAYSSSNVTPSGTWANLPTFAQNTSATRKLYSGSPYVQQCNMQSGGTIVVTDPTNYRDFAHLKTADAVAQRTSISSGSAQNRYLPAGTTYLQFTGVATGTYDIEWEERPL
jgi:hypothetical protein